MSWASHPSSVGSIWSAEIRRRRLDRVSEDASSTAGACSLHCLQVLIEAASGTDNTFHPIAIARTNRSGRFFVDYPHGPFTAARVWIPGVENPLPLAVTDVGLLAPEALLVIDLPEAQHVPESNGCDCGSTDVPRLPGRDELAEASSTFSTDLGDHDGAAEVRRRHSDRYSWNAIRAVLGRNAPSEA